MAARWGAREDSLATGNMEYFSTYTLDEVGVTRGNIDVLDMSDQLDAGDALEAFHGCLDSSILSIFEDSAAAEEVRCRIDEESEAALLTALTEVLDNVDGGTLSPFDTLPDPELFSGQKGREQSPLRRLRSLARSPPESEPLCSPRSITSYLGNVEGACSDRHWKAKPLLRSQDVALQRSDGEEEEDLVIDGGLAQGPLCDAALPSLDAVELGALLNEDWDHASLDDLARHMHPYCLAVSVDLVEGEQVLPEGWIMLEVVDRGEQGEPILAVAEALPPVQQGAPEEEHPGTTTPINETPSFAPITEERSEEAGEEERKKQTVQKCPSGRRKKRKTKGQKVCVKPRVSRSMQPEQSLEARAPETAKEKQPENKSQTLRKKKRVSFAPVLASVLDAPTSPEFVPSCTLERPSCPAPPTATTDSLPGPESLKPLVGDGPTAPVPQQLEEARPKPLSLQQYRLLRQQKRPAPVEKQEGNSTKWPTLPEPPSELPPIPCLLETVPTREPQRAPAERMGTGVAQVWQPKNSTAPPTPEALLFPPGSVVPPSKALGPVLVPKLAGGMQNQNQLAAPAPKLASAVEVKPQESVSCVARQSHLAPLDQPILHSDSTPLHGSHRQPSLPSRLPTVEKALPAGVLPIAQALCPQATTDAPVSKTTALLVAPVTKLTKGPMPAQAGLPAASLPTRGRPQRVAQKKLLPSETSPTDKLLIQAFTSEIGIEAADLTSLLEQFEETQAKEEHAVPEVCGRAAAVGNSGKAMECLGVPDLGSTAGLTPPATPPHPTWKPLAPAALLATPKPSASKSVQIIEPRPMPPCKARSKSTVPPAATVQPPLDHDYCLPSGEPLVTQLSTYQRGKRQQEEQAVGHVNQPLDHRTLVEKGAALAGSVLLSPDASPTRPETDALVSLDKKCPGSGKGGSHLSERSAAPPARERGRVRMRYRVRSPSTESSSRSESSSGSSSESRSRSRSCSPPRKRFCSRSRRSESSSSSDSSCYSPSRSPPRRRRYSYSSSRSGSWSRSQSRSCSPRWRRRSRSPSPSHRNTRRYDSREQFQCQEVKNRKEKAIEERRVVYVGKIRGGMTRKELKERFSLYGEIEECALHFRDHGDNYGFVTYYNTKDAFNAIENGSKLRQSDELPFDLCFGGRRQFCRSNYADLDSNRDYDPTPKKSKLDTLDFDTLLKQAQKGLRR